MLIRDPLVWATIAIALATVAMGVVAYLQLKALWLAESTTQAAERPFVTASGLDINYDGIGYWFFRVRAQNSGNTPTRNLQYVVTTARAPTDPEDIFRVTPDYVSKFRGIIGPKTTLPVFGLSGLPAKTIEEMATRRENYFVFGVFHYQDWFSNLSNHLTKFCFAAIPYLEGDKVNVRYEPCLFWNCADDECETDKREYEKEVKRLNPHLRSNE
jgi:hypothetical protein